MMEPSASASDGELVEKLGNLLGERLVALYRFGFEFGPMSVGRIRVLLVIDHIDVKTLDAIAAVISGMAGGRVNLRVHTADQLLQLPSAMRPLRDYGYTRHYSD